MNRQRMTIGQLYMAIGKEEKIHICSLYDIGAGADLTMDLIGYTGIMALEVYSLSHTEGGYVAIVDLPPAAIEALTTAQ